MRLNSYAEGHWVPADDGGVPLVSAVDGAPVALCGGTPLDYRAMLDYARGVGGPRLRMLGFHQRGLMLKALAKYLDERKDEFYAVSTLTGATRKDSWFDIDGGISTMFVYASKARREMPDSHIYLDGLPEQLSRRGSFLGQHVYTSRHGVAVHINAFNFPCWGMLEKIAPALLAGMPAIVKPATSTAFLTELVFRRIIESEILPEGALQLVCGSLGDLFDHLGCQDAVAFTGSKATADKLRAHPRVIAESVSFTAEADSLNAAVLGPDAAADTPEFALFVEELVREMTSKAGQKCTAIRRAIVPEALAADVVRAASRALGEVRVGDPGREDVQMGALASLAQREEVRARVRELAAESTFAFGDPERFELVSGDRERGAFLAPILLYCRDSLSAAAAHRVEAFGPVSTVLPYASPDQAAALVNRGEGSLVSSVFTADEEFARLMACESGPYHGRMLFVNRDCAAESTGHGSPLAHLVHGGPGRAGGGEELGGVRGVLHYMQRTALQGSPATLGTIGARWIPGGKELDPGRHPFRKPFAELRLGDTFRSSERRVTIADIERFAELTGDKFYAHMDDEAAAANPFFEGRVAHGYFLVSAAAGLFVDPDPGPVLANYGIDNLRFLKPVAPGDAIRVRLTCKQKTLRAGTGYGEVRWDAEIRNQDDEVVATYDVLTMVAEAG